MTDITQPEELINKIGQQLEAMRESVTSPGIAEEADGKALSKAVNSFCEQVQTLLHLLKNEETGNEKPIDTLDDVIIF